MEEKKNSKNSDVKQVKKKQKDTPSYDMEMDSIIPDEILESIPEEERSKIKSTITQLMISSGSMMNRGSGLTQKITSEHIGSLICNADEQDKRDRKERGTTKMYNLVILVIGLIFLCFLIVFLKDDKELLYKVIIAIISFVGGFGLGRNHKQNHKEES